MLELEVRFVLINWFLFLFALMFLVVLFRH